MLKRWAIFRRHIFARTSLRLLFAILKICAFAGVVRTGPKLFVSFLLKTLANLGTSFAYTHDVRRFTLLFLFCGLALTVFATQLHAEGLAPSKTKFYYRTATGTSSAPIIRRYWRVPVVHPDARVDSRLDPRLCRAATIAEERANARSRARCWRYVKEALVASAVINSYPKTNYASEAGEDLVQNYGFRRLPINDQFAAPIGAVLVFGDGSNSHVVIRTKKGFASDYWTKNRCKYPLIAVYGKFSS